VRRWGPRQGLDEFDERAAGKKRVLKGLTSRKGGEMKMTDYSAWILKSPEERSKSQATEFASKQRFESRLVSFEPIYRRHRANFDEGLTKRVVNLWGNRKWQLEGYAHSGMTAR
jgi:hypothetical protein